MGALAVAHLQRAGATDIAVVNRTPSRASQLARRSGSVHVRAVPSEGISAALVQADVLVACAATSGAVLSRDWVGAVVEQRARDRAPLVICDLGLPRNVEAEVASVPGVILVDIQGLQAQGSRELCAQDVSVARRAIAAHLDDYRTYEKARTAAVRSASRAHAAPVVELELTRPDRRLPTMELDPVFRTGG